MAENVFIEDDTKNSIVVTLEEMNDSELIEEKVAGSFMDHDIDDCIPAVEGEAMSEGGIEKVDNAMEKSSREGVRFVFGFRKFHSSNDGFIDA